jgi:hypothetical protein
MKNTKTLLKFAAELVANSFESFNKLGFTHWKQAIILQGNEEKFRRTTVDRALKVMETVYASKQDPQQVEDLGKTFTETRRPHQKRSIQRNCNRVVTALLLASEASVSPLRETKVDVDISVPVSPSLWPHPSRSSSLDY